MANGTLAPSGPALQSISTSNTGLVLHKGGNDTKHIAGGKKGGTGEPVRELQEALAAIGVFKFTPDGDFGGGTHDAVRRFHPVDRPQRAPALRSIGRSKPGAMCAGSAPKHGGKV
jgi:peptidoglycan hydrolase-like protein with peptidoglycan-binding domain